MWELLKQCQMNYLALSLATEDLCTLLFGNNEDHLNKSCEASEAQYGRSQCFLLSINSHTRSSHTLGQIVSWNGLGSRMTGEAEQSPVFKAAVRRMMVSGFVFHVDKTLKSYWVPSSKQSLCGVVWKGCLSVLHQGLVPALTPSSSSMCRWCGSGSGGAPTHGSVSVHVPVQGQRPAPPLGHLPSSPFPDTHLQISLLSAALAAPLWVPSFTPCPTPCGRASYITSTLASYFSPALIVIRLFSDPVQEINILAPVGSEQITWKHWSGNICWGEKVCMPVIKVLPNRKLWAENTSVPLTESLKCQREK